MLAPLPHYWTMFDVVMNVLGYLPFGMLLVFAVYPHLRGIRAALLASVAGMLWSAAMEVGQTFLPSRVPSNIDWLTNVAGTMIGALLGAWLAPLFVEQSRFLRLRRRWFAAEAGRGLIVLALWPLAQIYPQSTLFGQGQILPVLSGWLSDWLSSPIDLNTLLWQGEQLIVEQYWLAETIVAACGATGAALTLLYLLRPKTPRALLVVLLVTLALATKALASALQFTPANAFVWLTPAAQGGLLVSGLMLTGLIFAPHAAQRRVAILMLLIGVVVVNVLPENPYFVATLQTWVQGRFLNFNGAAQGLALIWPFAALWCLLDNSERV